MSNKIWDEKTTDFPLNGPDMSITTDTTRSVTNVAPNGQTGGSESTSVSFTGVATCTFDSGAATDGRIVYQWYENGVGPVGVSTRWSGESTDTLTINYALSPEDNGKQYYFQASYVPGAVDGDTYSGSSGEPLSEPVSSTPATLNVLPELFIASGITSSTVSVDTNTTFSCLGGINADKISSYDTSQENDITYQWYVDGSSVTDGTRQTTVSATTFTNTYAEKLIRAKKNSPEYKQLKEEAFNDPKFDGLPFLKKVELIEDLDEKDTEFARLQHSSTIENVDAFFAKYRSRHGILYDENEANQELNKILSNFPPELSEYVADQWSNFQTMSNTKRVTGKANLSQINTLAGRLADNAVKSRYPEIGEKLLRGDDGNLDLGKYLGTRSEAIRTGDIELRQILTDAAIDALQDVADEGGSLDVKDQGKIISDAMNLVIKDKERMNGVLPAIAEKKEEKGSEEKKAETPPTFKLDTHIPGERLKEGAYLNAPVFDAPTTEKLIEEIRTGRRLPVPVINAALRAGVSPQQFILDTAGFYKDEDWYPSDMERIRLLKEGNDEKGFADSMQSRSPLSSPFSTATNHLAIVLTGKVPPRFQ